MAALRVMTLWSICLVFIPVPIHAADAAQFAGGTGKPNDPYQIATTEQLIAIGSDPNFLDKHFVLIKDIHLQPNPAGGQISAPESTVPITPSRGNGWDSLLSTVAGGLIALIGVMVTLRWNERSNQAKLVEERRKAKEEREFVARQATFMAVGEAAIRYIHYFLSLADRPLPTDGAVPKEMTELAVALSRLHFYCGIETIDKAIQLSHVLDSAVGDVLAAKMAPSFSREDLRCIEVQLSGLENMNAHIQEEIVAMLQSDPRNPLITSHREESARICRQMAALCEQKCEITRKQYAETEKCRDAILRHTKAIYEASCNVLLLARREISFPIDETRYREVMGEYLTKAARRSAGTITELRQQVVQKIDACDDEHEQVQ